MYLINWGTFQERMNLASILGAGLLVGAALTVIIPEGIQMLYSQVIEGQHFLSLSIISFE